MNNSSNPENIASSPGNTASALECLPDATIDAAILWLVKLDYGKASAETLQSFEQWLQADRSHALAWARVGSLQQGLSQLPTQLLLKAMQTFDSRQGQRKLDRRQALKLLSLTGVAASVGWGVHEYAPWQRLFADASTALGEQKTLTLADGTTLLLNSDSAMGIDFSGERRLLVLKRGEILVATGADTGAATRRPFWVYTRHGRMQALGTRFVVRLDERDTRIAVQDGAVSLHPADSDASEIIHAGESRRLASTKVEAAEQRGFEIDAWTDGVIAGKHILLTDLLAELERYRPGRIVCDERVANLRVSGVFQIRNTDSALEFLRQTQPVSIAYRTRYWVVVGPRSDA